MSDSISVSANHVRVALRNVDGTPIQSYPARRAKETRSRRERLISAAPGTKFEIVVEIEPEISFQEDADSLLISIAYDDGRKSTLEKDSRTNAWVLRKDWSPAGKHTFRKQYLWPTAEGPPSLRSREVPQQIKQPRFPRPTVVPRSGPVMNTYCVRGCISIYVQRGLLIHEAQKKRLGDPPTTTLAHILQPEPLGPSHPKLINPQHFSLLYGARSSVAEFHFANMDMHRANYTMRLAEGNFALHLRPRVGSGFHWRDEELDYDESRVSEYEDSDNDSHELDATTTSAEPSILTRRGTLNNNGATSREVDPPRRPTRRSARARTREAKSPQATAAKQKLFEMVDDDQDDEEPALPNPKQEDGAQAPTLARIRPYSSMREVSAAEVGTSARGKAKERARLSRQLEDIEIEERELELKKRKRDLQRRMMELDEE